jgi:hypothetical protein
MMTFYNPFNKAKQIKIENFQIKQDIDR